MRLSRALGSLGKRGPCGEWSMTAEMASSAVPAWSSRVERTRHACQLFSKQVGPHHAWPLCLKERAQLPRGGVTFLPEGLLTFGSRLSSRASPHEGALGPQPPLPAQLHTAGGLLNSLSFHDPVGETFRGSPARGRGESGQDMARGGERKNSLLERELDLRSQ